MDDLGDVVRCWQRGWGASRGLPDGEEADGAVRVRCDQMGREVEYVAYDDAPVTLRALAGRVLAETPVTWLTVPTTAPERTGAALTAAGLILLKDTERMMETDLRTQPRVALRPPYRMHVEDGPAVHVTVSHPDCAVAAKGSVGLAGEVAVADRIGADPAHRRRGLGSAVMSALAGAAVRHGAHRGLLIASDDGQRLYTALGWRPLATVLIAAAPGTVYPV